MKLEAILFDLDDTLLQTNMDVFLQHYFQLLAEHVQHLMPADSFVQSLLASTSTMIDNDGSGRSNSEVFWLDFVKRTGVDREQFQHTVDRFYAEKFGQLKSITRPKTIAPKIVATCKELGFKMVIATNPLFPRAAIEQRLRWAGLWSQLDSFALITSYENMHATKPNVAYYEEILNHIAVEARHALMVGDEIENDIQPAVRLGMRTYWISPQGASDGCGSAHDCGTLEEFYETVCSWKMDQH